MRILIFSVPPGQKSGYSIQTLNMIKMFTSLGHEVVGVCRSGRSSYNVKSGGGCDCGKGVFCGLCIPQEIAARGLPYGLEEEWLFDDEYINKLSKKMNYQESLENNFWGDNQISPCQMVSTEELELLKTISYYHYPFQSEKQIQTDSTYINRIIEQDQIELIIFYGDIFRFSLTYSCPIAACIPLHSYPLEEITVNALIKYDYIIPLTKFATQIVSKYSVLRNKIIFYIPLSLNPTNYYLPIIPIHTPLSKQGKKRNKGGKNKGKKKKGEKSAEKLKHQVRQKLGLPVDKFIFLIIGANAEPTDRKCFRKQIEAYSLLTKDSYYQDKIHLHFHTSLLGSINIISDLVKNNLISPSSPLCHPTGDGTLREQNIWINTHDIVTSTEHTFSFVNQEKYQSGLPSEYMTKLYTSVDLLLYCSKSEGFGLPIIEAQSLGCPVLTTNFASMPELIQNGKCIKLEDLQILSNGREDDTYLKNITQRRATSRLSKGYPECLGKINLGYFSADCNENTTPMWAIPDTQDMCQKMKYYVDLRHNPKKIEKDRQRGITFAENFMLEKVSLRWKDFFDKISKERIGSRSQDQNPQARRD